MRGVSPAACSKVLLCQTAPRSSGSRSPQQIHFEWVVADVAAAAECMTGVGARRADWQDDTDPDLLVMLDPAGHPFCLIASSSVGEFKNEAQHQMR